MRDLRFYTLSRNVYLSKSSAQVVGFFLLKVFFAGVPKAYFLHAYLAGNSRGGGGLGSQNVSSFSSRYCMEKYCHEMRKPHTFREFFVCLMVFIAHQNIGPNANAIFRMIFANKVFSGGVLFLSSTPLRCIPCTRSSCTSRRRCRRRRCTGRGCRPLVSQIYTIFFF